MYDLRNLTISSTNPCLLVYLIDQSGSMSLDGKNKRSRNFHERHRLLLLLRRINEITQLIE